MKNQIQSHQLTTDCVGGRGGRRSVGGGIWFRILYFPEGFSLKRSICILNIIFTGKFNLYWARPQVFISDKLEIMMKMK